jgi:mono/diheme cytochrome c family protein
LSFYQYGSKNLKVRFKMKKIILPMLLASIGLIASEGIEVPYKPGLLLPPQGDKIYAQECATCHGADAKQTSFTGFPEGIKYAKIAGMEAKSLAKTIKEYRGGVESNDYQPLNKYGYGAAMAAPTRDLSCDEIDAVAEYISGLK